jgi:hypothetical protein
MKKVKGIVLYVLITALLLFVNSTAASAFPVTWWVNGNGYTGLLLYRTNPSTGRIKGILLNTPVEGYIVGRHIVLHRYPQGKRQLWEGWIMDRRLGASIPSYKKDYFIAGTISVNGDQVYPWFGIEKGKTGGVPNTNNTTNTHNNYPKKNIFSCKHKDNQEKGCCCFKGAHTYLFNSRYIQNVLVEFDTGKRFNCHSTVALEIKQGDRWIVLRKVKANSSKNGSEINPIRLTLPVHRTIEGFRISDGCACCIDSSKIVLNGNFSIKPKSSPKAANISGNWRWFDGETVWIYKNGTCRSSRGNRGRWSAKWNGSTYIYTINWNNGQYVDTLNLHGNTLDGHNRGGTHVWGKRY